MSDAALTERERKVLAAVIEAYVETAEPAGSRTIAKRSGLGVSAATIRNTMSDLEEKGFLYHPHTSAGRIPTDKGYRTYVNALVGVGAAPPLEATSIREQLETNDSAAESILVCAARVLGVVTQELGMAVGPSLDATYLVRLELIRTSAERLLLVMTLRSGAVRSIFVDVRSSMPPASLASVQQVLNERLAGLTLKEIRSTLTDRLRDAAREPREGELLNIFIEEADGLFQDVGERDVHLGSTRVLADQPEFASNEQMRNLLALTEQRDLLRAALRQRAASPLTISIGSEHHDPTLESFTLITASYKTGALSGVIGVMGPTRMPYEKVIALVNYTSRLVGELIP